MSYGKDERHIDKYVWQLPIPLYDAMVEAHRALAALGARAEAEIVALALCVGDHPFRDCAAGGARGVGDQ